MSPHPEIHHLAKEERIRAIAYSLWEEEGRPDGNAETHWLKACALVDAEAEPRDEAESAAEPDWLKREAAPEPVETAERPMTIEQLARRLGAGKAA